MEKRTLATRVQWPHVKYVHALHLPENLKSLETRRLVEIGGHGADGGAGAEEVGLVVDV